MRNASETKITAMDKIKLYFYVVAVMVLIFSLMGILSQVKGQRISAEKKNALSQADEAAEAFARVMANEKREVFLSLLENTQCVVVFPSIKEADYLEIKNGRRGMASCRNKELWGAAVFVVLQTTAVDAGRRQSDLVFFFKQTEGLTGMLSGKTTFGKSLKFKEFSVDVTEFGDKTDVLIFGNKESEINVDTLNQSSILEGKKFMRKTYGQGTSITEWLKEPSKYAPDELYSFNNSIKRFENGQK